MGVCEIGHALMDFFLEADAEPHDLDENRFRHQETFWCSSVSSFSRSASSSHI